MVLVNEPGEPAWSPARVQESIRLLDHHAVVQRHADGCRDLDRQGEEPAAEHDEPTEAPVGGGAAAHEPRPAG